MRWISVCSLTPRARDDDIWALFRREINHERGLPVLGIFTPEIDGSGSGNGNGNGNG